MVENLHISIKRSNLGVDNSRDIKLFYFVLCGLFFFMLYLIMF